MKDAIKKTVTSFKELLRIYPWLKLVFTSLIGVLGGTTVITFLNKYAIYNYAVSFGGRLPIESVPYIDVAISILSFSFFTICLFSVLSTYALFTYISKIIAKILSLLDHTVSKFLDHTVSKILGHIVSKLDKYSNILSILLIGYIIYIVVKVFVMKEVSSFEPLYDEPFTPYDHYKVIFISWILLFLFPLVEAQKNLIMPIALVISILLIVLVTTRLFDAHNYSSFLRTIQYGGGTPVTLTYGDDKKFTKGFLFLTTKNTNVIWLDKQAEFIAQIHT